MKLFIFLTAILIAAHQSQAAVWVDNKTWTPEIEAEYSKWVQDSYNEDFYTSGKWKGIPTDCADAVYHARIVFAFENKLPFAIKDPTGGQYLITNKMSRFDGTKSEVQKVRYFMNYISEIVSTKTLPRDTYPVLISPAHIKPGTIWLRASIASENWLVRMFSGPSAPTGHTETVKSIRDTGIVELIGSTVPQKVRSLVLTTSFVSLPKETTQGLRNWILPQNMKIVETEQPGFSLEQYKMGIVENHNNSVSGQRYLEQWEKDVISRLKIRDENKGERRDRFARDLCNLAKARIEVVKDALSYKNYVNRCLTQDEFDAYSTPSRDKRIESVIGQMLDADGGFFLFRSLDRTLERLANHYEKCGALTIAPGKEISLPQFLLAIDADRVSSNPNHSLESRWGLLEQIEDNTCPTFD